MSFQKNNKFKPVFKQFVKLRENIQDRPKLLKFKKKKWESFLKFYLNKLKNFRKFKPLDHSKYFVTKQGTRGLGYQRRFRDTLHASRRIRILFGNLLKRYFKQKIHSALKRKYKLNTSDSLETIFLRLFENRLDIVLYRAKFAPTVRSARQLILHGKVYVNRVKVISKAYHLKAGDIINLNLNSINLYENHIVNSEKWPIPPKYLIINYKTLEILFLDQVTGTNLGNQFSFNLKLQKVLGNYSKQ